MNRQPSTLGSHVSALVEWLDRQFAIPPHSEYRILDTTDRRLRWLPESHDVWTIRISSLQTVEDFAPRFDELLRFGYGWINLTALAIHQGIMIFGVEVPEEAAGVPPGSTSVNYSGPAVLPGTHTPGWTFRGRIAE